MAGPRGVMVPRIIFQEKTQRHKYLTFDFIDHMAANNSLFQSLPPSYTAYIETKRDGREVQSHRI
jgi:hypothetical protein